MRSSTEISSGRVGLSPPFLPHKQSGKLTIPLLALLAICLFGRPAEAQYGGGTGEPNNPYLIFTAAQMNAIGANSDDWDKHFKLVVDIDFVGYTGTDFNIIGYWRSWGDNKPFTGVFDGNGKKISNFTCTSADTDYIGLFGCVKGEHAEVKDLGLINPNIDAGTGDFVGSLGAYLIDATISGCYAKAGSVSGRWAVGGLVGENRGTIINCNSSGSVSGDDGVGGLVGHITYNGRITNCYSSAGVSGTWSVGGLVGDNPEGTIANCHTIGSVTGDRGVGGLVGQNYGVGTITNCYSTGSVTGNNAVGGMVGENYGDGTITNCYSTVSVSGAGSVGGLVGNNYAKISGCCATGSVSGSYDVGGLVGAIRWYGTIANCYSISSVFGESKVGGLIGSKSEYGTPTVMDSFWDIQTSGQPTSDGGTGKTTAEMQMESTFTDAGWDFVDETENGTEDIWWILEGQDYPRLWWQLWAFSPHPQDRATDVIQPLLLSWAAGRSALHHDVYLGEDEEAVGNATTASSGIYRGRQVAEMTSYDPGTLVWGKTYYWRIDEVNELDLNSPWKGDLWSFTLVPETANVAGSVGSHSGLYVGAGSTLELTGFFSSLIDDIRIHSAALRTGSITWR